MTLPAPWDWEGPHSAQALDPAAADPRAHRFTPDAAGFSTATRHASLVVALYSDARRHLGRESSADRYRAGGR